MGSPHHKAGKGSILIVDDDLSARQTLAAIVEGEGYEVQCAPSGHTALTFAREEPPELILLDIRLPDVDGFELCQRLKSDAGTCGIPVIFLGAVEDVQDIVKGFVAGGVDYVTKPFHAEEVLARVRTHVALHQLQSDLGRLVEQRTVALQAAKAELEKHIEALDRSERELQERLRFETLLAELSAEFVNVPAERVDGKIVDAQRRVCECLGLDLSALWEWSVETPQFLTLTHLYRPLGGPPLPDRLNSEELFPWALRKILRRESVVVSRHADLPAEATHDLEVWRQYGIKSTLGIPLSVGGGPILGALSFDTMRAERDWSEPIVQRLQLVAQIFANALARRRADEALRTSEARLTLAAASADARLWELDPHTGKVWTTEKGRAFYGIPQEQPLTLERIVNMIHPEDRERVRRSIEEALQSGQTMHIEYRVVRPDGAVRWIASQGRVSVLSADRPGRLMGVSLDITEGKQMEEQLQARLLEIERLKQELEQENVYLREEAKHLFGHEEVVGQSDPMRRVLAQVDQVSRTDSTVFIVGETGTGKKLIARAIHNLSRRKDRTLVTVNCASLPPSLIESELFGREKGAYTGAMTMMKGRFEFADGSTLFLDEIGDLSLEVQAKLLRVLEDGQFERLGSSKTVRVDVRILAATNRDLVRDVQSGRFRKDLYYRLNVFPIAIPPLRERPEDIPLLAWSFVREFEKVMGKRIESIPRRTMEALQRYTWPGNVRELRNVIEHAMIISIGKSLEVRIPALSAEEPATSQALEDIERKHILSVLEKTRWRLTGEGGAAEQLGLKRTTLQSRMKKLGITRPTR
jgi:PAS domain S-box-containing protein